MRARNSILNILVSIASQFVIALFGFLSRKVFIDSLGATYLGLNGLLTSVLSMLGLAEMGIGASIVYSLYKPLADKDEEKITALVQLYRKLYRILSAVVFMLSVMFYPFLDDLMNGGEEIKDIGVIYAIFVVRNIITYSFAHKWSLISADQKSYMIDRNNIVFQILLMSSRIFILLEYGDYILFLVVELFFLLAQNLYNGRVVDKVYPYLKTKARHYVDEATRSSIITNVKALFLHNIGSYCIYGTSNLLISYFINLTTVGLYSNYSMLVSQVLAFLNPMFNGVGASIGNMIATESREKTYFIFRVFYLVNFVVFSSVSIFLVILVEPFIAWWLGSSLLLDKATFFLIVANFYISGLRMSIGIFKVRGGIFVQDKYVPLLEAALNLGVSILLVKYIGLAGIFLGTIISMLLTVFWTAPYLVYRHLFKIPSLDYYRRYYDYFILTALAGYISVVAVNAVFDGSSLLSLTGMGVLSMTIPCLIYAIVFFSAEEVRYLWNLVPGLGKRMRGSAA